jgi:hypothetical protein
VVARDAVPRLRAGHLRAELERAPAGDICLISLCAGQGRDVIGVLTGHPCRDDVRARLVELDERAVALARPAAGGWAARLHAGGSASARGVSPPRWRWASGCSPSRAELS